MEIEFENVTYTLRVNTPLEYKLLNDISFSIKENTITGFLGNSGNGKSTIPKLISALVKPTSGTIKVYGKVINGKKIKDINKFRSSIGYVYENPDEMFVSNSVRSEIVFALDYFKYPTKSKVKRVEDALKIVGLDKSYLSLKLNKLSLNDKKKIALASVLVYNPKIIILDEPCIGLSVKEKKELIRIIRLLKNKHNKTIIILTKDTDFLYKIANYVYILDGGSIVAYGETDLLLKKELLDTYGLYYPSTLEFTYLANMRKNANLEYYKDVSDLIKGVYRSVF